MYLQSNCTAEFRDTGLETVAEKYPSSDTPDRPAGSVERWLLAEAASWRRLLLAGILPAALAGILLVLQARLLAGICHALIIDKTPLPQLSPKFIAVAILLFGRSILTFTAERLLARGAGRLKSGLRSRLLRLLFGRSTAELGAGSGELAETVCHGVDSLENYFTRFLPQLVLAAIIPAATLFFVFPVEWRSSLVLLLSAPFIPLFMILIGRGAEALNRRQWQRLAVLSGYLLDQVRGLPDIRFCSAIKRQAAAVRRHSEDYRITTMAVLRVAFLSAFTLEFFTTVGTAVVAVIIGFRLLEGQLILADGLFLLLVAPEFYLPFRSLGLSYHARMQGVAAAEQLAPLLTSRPARPVASGSGVLPAPAGPLTMLLTDVTFAYGTGRAVLAGVNLQLAPGTITAVTGSSGAGKSTLASVLAGIVPPAGGSVTANGVDIAAIDRQSWLAMIAWLPQRPCFFAGSIRDNLLLGLPADLDDAGIDEALTAAGAFDFVSVLPDGLATTIGEGGTGLSGGELRRLAIARILLRRPALVILDEPTAGLDRANEEKVGAALRRLAATSTVLLISHRAETVRWADRVYSLCDGKLFDRSETHG